MLSSLNSVLPLVIAVLLHEAGHILAARAVGMKFGHLRLTPTGLRLITKCDFSSYDDELTIALGGPMANALSALLMRLLCSVCPLLVGFSSRFIPLSLSLALLNLLPLRSFDGARILYCLACCHHRRLPSLVPDQAEHLITWLSCLVLTGLWLLSVYLLLRCGSALSLYLFCLQLFLCLASENNHAQEKFA